MLFPARFVVVSKISLYSASQKGESNSGSRCYLGFFGAVRNDRGFLILQSTSDARLATLQSCEAKGKHCRVC